MIAAVSVRVRRMSTGVLLFSSMKKCGIREVGRNALGDQIHVASIDGDSFSFTCARLGPTFFTSLCSAI